MKCRDRSSDFVLRVIAFLTSLQYANEVRDRCTTLIAVIENSDELKRILRHLVKIGRSPPGFDPGRLKPRGVPERSEERSRH